VADALRSPQQKAPVTPPKRWFGRASIALWLGATLFFGLVIMAALAPHLAPYDPNQIPGGQSLAPPAASFLLGTDSIGRDTLSRVIWGSRISLMVSLPSVALAVLIGIVLGTIAGYTGGWVDEVIMRSLDVAFAFPAVLLAIAMVAVLGPSIPNLILTIGLVFAPRFVRVVRAPILVLSEQEFVQAARSVGAGPVRIIIRHILPNAIAPLLVEASLSLSRAMITETALAFLGMGAPPPDPTWGSMMSRNRQFMEMAPWAVMAPGLAIMVASASFVMLGNGLRDLLDPRRRS
jgi:peptide/nickel transport system permease protein